MGWGWPPPPRRALPRKAAAVPRVAKSLVHRGSSASSDSPTRRAAAPLPRARCAAASAEGLRAGEGGGQQCAGRRQGGRAGTRGVGTRTTEEERRTARMHTRTDTHTHTPRAPSNRPSLTAAPPLTAGTPAAAPRRLCSGAAGGIPGRGGGWCWPPRRRRQRPGRPAPLLPALPAAWLPCSCGHEADGEGQRAQRPGLPGEAPITNPTNPTNPHCPAPEPPLALRTPAPPPPPAAVDLPAPTEKQ
jgi:hypothetical protein